jgi:hypothetical protein
VGGVFNIWRWKFLWVVCTWYYGAVLRFFILAFYGPKGISGDRRYCTVLHGVVCIVSHGGELCCYVKQVNT